MYYATNKEDKVMVFGTRKSRNKYVEAEKQATAIKKADCPALLDDPKPFTGECYCIDTRCVSRHDHFMSLFYADYAGTLCTDFPYKDQIVKWR